MNDIEKLREIWLSDVDEETRKENEEQIKEWERGLIRNEALLDWRSHDITREVAQQAKKTYKDLFFTLAERRDLSDEKRMSIWAKQDAIQWILSLTEQDPVKELERIKKEIRMAINAA